MGFFRVRRLLFGLCASITVGCSSSKPEEPPLAQTALKAELVAQAISVSSAVSALDSLAAGDTATAKSTLEGLLSSELTKMYVLRPELKGGDQTLVDDSIRAAEEYAHRHDLKILKPAP